MAFKTLPKSVMMLGFVSMFMDLSSEMIHSLLPVFMVSVLGISAFSVGIIEGVAEATASIIKVFSGVLSDWFGKRKPLLIFGYGLAAFTKPLFPIAEGITTLFTARFIDRIGKGIRGAPRDALVADLVPKNKLGAAFGLRQSLDKVGAFLGPALAMLLMFLFLGDFRLVFWVAVIPAFISVGCIIFGVKEPDEIKLEEKRPFPLQKKELKKLERPFWMVVVFAGIFTLARFSEAFLLLRADHLGLTAALIPSVLIVMNIVYAGLAYPIGTLSDKIGKNAILVGGILMLILADLILAFADNLFWVFLGTIIWGLHMGMTQGVLSALVADKAPKALRGTAFGVFHLVSGLSLLLASVIAGGIWGAYGPTETFLVGAVFAFISLVAFGLIYSKPVQ